MLVRSRTVVGVLSGLAPLLAICGSMPVTAVHAATLTPDEMKVLLLSGTDSQRAQLSRDLSLRIPRTTRHHAKADISCTNFDSVQSSIVTLEHPGPQAVLFIVASLSCGSAFVVVLEQTSGEGWKRLDTVWLLARNRIPRMDFKSLVQADEQEIIVRNNETDTGTGVEVTDLSIFKLFGSRLDLIFDEPEHASFAEPIGDRQIIDQSEDNEFTFVRDTSELNAGPSLLAILEKQIIRDNHTKMTRWWQYVWIPELRRFRKYQTWR
jgi:hypothetical protein